MCKVMEDMRNEALNVGVMQAKTEMILKLLDMGLTYEQLAKASSLTINQVKEIAGQKTN